MTPIEVAVAGIPFLPFIRGRERMLDLPIRRKSGRTALSDGRDAGGGREIPGLAKNAPSGTYGGA